MSALVVLNKCLIADQFKRGNRMFQPHHLPPRYGQQPPQSDTVIKWIDMVLVKFIMRNYKRYTNHVLDIQADDAHEQVEVYLGGMRMNHYGRERATRRIRVVYATLVAEAECEGRINSPLTARLLRYQAQGLDFELPTHNDELKFLCAHKGPVNLRVFPGAPPELHDLVHFLHTEPNTLPKDFTRMSVPHALMRLAEWHTRIAADAKEKKVAVRDAGEGNRTELGRGDIGNQIWVYEQLNDKQALAYEGSVQHHCVESYWPHVQRGSITIVSAYVKGDQSKRFTFEFQNQGTLVLEPMSRKIIQHRRVVLRQLRGLLNALPPTHISHYLKEQATEIVTAHLPSPQTLTPEQTQNMPRDAHGWLELGLDAGKWFDI